MLAKQKREVDETWLRPVAKLIGISVVILVCLIVGTFIGLSANEPDLATPEAHETELSKALGEIASLSEQQWQTQNEAMATALLMTDAFISGGMEKATEIFDATMAKASEAEELQAAITATLSKHGFPVSSDYR